VFVSTNSVGSVKRYFYKQLNGRFSEREIWQLFLSTLTKRLQLSDSQAILSDHLRLSESDLLFFRNVVKRLLANEPFQYIQGETLFYNLTIKTDPRALIPRPETEELVHWIVQSSAKELSSSKATIIDIGTGSGCIALALKNALPNSSVWGIDKSANALQLAQENAQILQIDVHLCQSDILNESIEHYIDQADIIVSNPPYVLYSEKSDMQAHVLDHEPHAALFVPDHQALVFYEAIAQIAQRKLKENGWLYVEINERYAQQIAKLIEKYGFANSELRQDMQGKNRMIRAQATKNRYCDA